MGIGAVGDGGTIAAEEVTDIPSVGDMGKGRGLVAFRTQRNGLMTSGLGGCIDCDAVEKDAE
jgi:hypothetical protein